MNRPSGELKNTTYGLFVGVTAAVSVAGGGLSVGVPVGGGVLVWAGMAMGAGVLVAVGVRV